MVPTLGVFAAIVNEQKQILCVRLNYASKGWTTPGGRVEAGESPLDALRREVMEETGLKVEPEELIGVYSKPREDDVVLSFTVRITGQHPWKPDQEIAEVGYFGKDDLPQPMSVAARTRIIDAFDGSSCVFRIIGGDATEVAGKIR